MNYRTEIEIDLPRARVVELFDHSGNRTKWQPNLRSFEHLSGDPGQAGAKSRLIFQMGRKDVTMVEIITRNELPDLLTATYETRGVHNQVEVRFVDLGPERTKWIQTSEFRFTGLMKLMALVRPGCFKKESERHMLAFKNFAEAQGSPPH